MEDFNLLVSSSRGSEKDANRELRYLLREFGDKSAKTDYTPVSGLTVAKTDLSPIGTIAHLRGVLRQRPWEFRYILKVKPVERVVRSNVELITSAAVEQASEIGVGETFRVSVEKRQNQMSSREIIDAVASKVSRKVDLQNPDKIVLIEIIGQVAGISVVPPGCILGVEREKKHSSLLEPLGRSARL